jgi:unsaturated rhamnogalacturonyl hydrolase
MLLGMDRLWRSTGDDKYFDHILSYADGYNDADSNIAAYRGNSQDSIMPGSIIMWAYQQTGEARYRRTANKVRETFDTFPRSWDGSFFHNDVPVKRKGAHPHI